MDNKQSDFLQYCPTWFHNYHLQCESRNPPYFFWHFSQTVGNF